MSEKKELLEESKKLIEKYKMMSFGVGEGYFIEPYSSSSSSSSNERPFAASIYYLLDQNDIDKFHKLDFVMKFGIIIKELELIFIL